MNNERKPLKLGYVMVKNRSAAQLKSGALQGPRAAERAEREFFLNHPVWKNADRSLLGVQNLTTKLTGLLTKRIIKVLPELKWELQDHFNQAEKAAKRLGDAPPAGAGERSKLVLQLFSNYATLLMSSARGDYRETLLSSRPHLRLRAVADKSFRSLEAAISEQKPDFEAADFTEKLHQELKALRGRELPGLLNSYFFYGFMARHVEMWRPRIEAARQDLYDVAREAGCAIADEVFPAYPGCAAAVRDVLGEYPRPRRDPSVSRKRGRPRRNIRAAAAAPPRPSVGGRPRNTSQVPRGVVRGHQQEDRRRLQARVGDRAGTPTTRRSGLEIRQNFAEMFMSTPGSDAQKQRTSTFGYRAGRIRSSRRTS